MYILGFETTGHIGSAALLDLESGETRSIETEEPLSHLKNTAAMASKLFAEAGIEPKTGLAAVAASVGPGSFTGIRIGVTMARSMATALEIPCVSVPTLSVFKDRCAGLPVAGILNARRGQVYGVIFDGEGNEILKQGPYMLTDVLRVTDGFEKTLFYGDGVDAYGEILTGNGQSRWLELPEKII